MNTWKTSNKYEIHLALGGRSNVYLIQSAKGNILVDTAKTNNYTALLKNLKRLLKHNYKIDYLILTHAHYDHCQNTAKLIQEFNCEVIVGLGECPFIRQGYRPLPKGTYFPFNAIAALGKRLGRRVFAHEAFEADYKLKEIFSLQGRGYNVVLYPTPGHTAGSISVVVDNEVALVGDTMFGIFKNSIFPPFCDDVVTMYKSWKILYDLNCRLYLPGHGKAIKRNLLEREISALK